MRDEEGAVGAAGKARFLPWRIVGGAFLHFLVPFYLVAVVADLALGPHLANAEAVLRHILARSPMLLGGYAGLGVTATVMVALVDSILPSVNFLRALLKSPGISRIPSLGPTNRQWVVVWQSSMSGPLPSSTT